MTEAQKNEAIEYCCKFWGIPKEDVLSRNRKIGLIRVRHSIRYYLRMKFLLTYEDIAKETNAKDHGAVLNSVKVVDTRNDFKEFREVFKYSTLGNFKSSKHLIEELDYVLNTTLSPDQKKHLAFEVALSFIDDKMMAIQTSMNSMVEVLRMHRNSKLRGFID